MEFGLYTLVRGTNKTGDVLQPCEIETEAAHVSKMLCRLPVVSLPDDLSQQVNDSESGTIDDKQGPGVAVYFSSDGRTRADIYVGLILDGFKLYENISAGHPDIKMQFAVMPVIACPPDVVELNPDKNDAIAIQVLASCIVTGRYSVCVLYVAVVVRLHYRSSSLLSTVFND